MSFKDRVNGLYDRKVIKPLEKRVRAVAIFLDSELVNTTPVDTGRARMNWQVGLNTALTGIIPWSDESKKDTSFIPARQNDAIKGISGYKVTDTIYISNNLPYIETLNAGSSKQAPAGFVQNAIQRAKRLLK